MAYEYEATHHELVAPRPNRTIGCQDLLKDGACVHSGWLRRQSLRNKLKIFAWPQVYVVIARGCVYCYSNETSKKPASAISLYGYDKVFRAGEVTEREATWSFKLIHADPTYRTYLFSASSQKEMGHWMSVLKREMCRANGKLLRTDGDGANVAAVYQDAGSGSASGGSLSSQDLKNIESNIYEDSSLFVLPSDYTNKRESDDSGDEMDEVLSQLKLKERPPLPPPLPARPARMGKSSGHEAAVVKELQKQQSQSRFYQAPSSNAAVKDARVSEADMTSNPIRKRGCPDGSSVKREQADEVVDANDFWSSIFFHGSREKATWIIDQMAEDGVYLVRVNEDKSMVLHVYAKKQSKKFRLFEVDKQYTLQKESGDYFERVEDLIFFYYSNPIPTLDDGLNECYTQHPDYKKLTAP